MNLILPPDVLQRRWSIPDGDVLLSTGAPLIYQGEALVPYCVGARWWTRPHDGLKVIVSVDLHPRHGNLLHVSLSLPDKYPSWKLIREIRDAFFAPDVDCMMVLPRGVDYVNVHPNCFHLWQCPQEWGIQ